MILATLGCMGGKYLPFPPRASTVHSSESFSRLLHDTVNLDSQTILWNRARVNATIVKVHCSQIGDATINTFTLPIGSTNTSLAQPSPQDGQERFLFRDSTSTEDGAAWVNISIPAPPYWDSMAPGLNIVGYWGLSSDNSLPSKFPFLGRVLRDL